MVSVYNTDRGWFCSCMGSVTCHRNLHEAMDAAYRKANCDGASKWRDPKCNNS